MIKPTLDDVLTDANLIEAWAKVRENEGAAGVDGESIFEFESTLMMNLDTLRKEVRFETYRPRPLLRVRIEKPDSPGLRELSIPSVRDRVLQTAVALILTPIFEVEFEDCSYAYRKGFSVDQAVARVERLRDEGYVWVVDADILAYFDNIDHQRLMREVSRLVQDKEILALIRLWLTSKVRDRKRLFRLKKGVPQGSPLSPLLSNLYLDQLDDEMIDEHQRLVRFADDFLILCRSRKRADKALELTEEILQSLKLEINDYKTRIVDFNKGFKFLGVRFVRSLAFKTKQKGRLFDFPLRSESPDLPTDNIEEPEQELIAAPTSIALAFAEALDAQREDKLAKRLVPEQVAGKKTSAADNRAFSTTQNTDSKRLENNPAIADHDPRLRTLYLFKHGCVLGKTSERLVVYLKKQVIEEIPAIKVDQILVFGNSMITLPAMKFCLAEKIPIILLSGAGKYHGVIDSFSTDPVLLHRDQFRRADDAEFCLSLSKAILQGKLSNQRLLLMRHSRKRHNATLKKSADNIKLQIQKLEGAESLDSLRGHEGSAAKTHFAAMRVLLKKEWGFTGRNKRPPSDPVNALLSYGYTLLFYNVYALLRARGLNPHVGYLHPLRAGHPALASDLIEEFRAIIVDAVVLNLLLNRRLKHDDFILPLSADDPCLLTDSGRKKFIAALEAKFNAPVTHPASGYKLDYRRCIEAQVQHFAAVIRGTEAIYTPMVLR